jgi:hypothetical protein
MTEPEPDDDSSYPSNWRPSYIRERDERRTEMELAAGAMSKEDWADFVKRARGSELMPKTTSFADVKRFAASVAAAGGTLPQTFENLIRAHDVLADATALPAATQRPESGIVDAALDGSLTPEKLTKMLPAAASAAAVNEYAKTLASSVERVLLGTWHREMESGGADAVLDSMRPTFDRHAKEIAKARSLFNSESSAEHVLASGEPAVMTAWSTLNGHLIAVSKVAIVAREFGPRLGDYPMIVEYAGGDGHLLDDTAIMVADGGLLADSAHFQRPDQGHRSSPLFKVPLRLHTVASARSRYAQWAAIQFDRLHGGRDPGGWIGEDGQVHKHPVPKNPYRETADA